jgi:hypothetical protein
VEPLTRPTSSGSRTAAFLVAGALATVPAYFVLAAVIGYYAALGGVVFLWTSGIVWLLKRRHEDPTWDRRATSGRD